MSPNMLPEQVTLSTCVEIIHRDMYAHTDMYAGICQPVFLSVCLPPTPPPLSVSVCLSVCLCLQNKTPAIV